VLDRSLALLECFGFHRDRWRTNELARECDLPVPTVHRILGVLERQAYVQRDPDTREYRLGPAARRLGERSVGVSDLCSVARPVATLLATATDELTSIAVCDERGTGTSVPIVARGTNAMRRRVEEGDAIQLHAGAHAKVLLAHLPAARRDQILGSPLDPLAAGTITNPTALQNELETIHERGFATSFEEVIPGGWTVAMPVRNSLGQVVCALGVSQAASAVSQTTAKRDLKALKRAVGVLEHQLRSFAAT
jgi:DNA-binding IclR family transcriptional regulator